MPCFRRLLAAALAASLAGCLPSAADCYVSVCEDAATTSGASSSSSGGGGSTTACGTFGAPQKLATSTPTPRAIAADASFVYWVDKSGGYRVAKAVTSPIASPKLFAPTFAQDQKADCPGASVAPGALVLTPDAILWTLYDHCSPFQPFGPVLWIVPKDKSSAFGEGDELRDYGFDVALDGDQAIVSAYFEHDNLSAIVTSDLAGANATPPFVNTPYTATAIAVTSKWLYFTQENAPAGARGVAVGLFRAPRARLASAPETIDDAGVVTKLVVDKDSGSVFYLSGADVKRFDGAGSPATLASEPAETPTALAIDDSCVYWGLSTGHVRAAPKQGGRTVDIASITTAALAADAAGVYVADGDDGAIWMIPKSP